MYGFTVVAHQDSKEDLLFLLQWQKPQISSGNSSWLDIKPGRLHLPIPN